MKRLVCEVCGSPELLKDGGVFVCQSCGCKYTVDEVRKLMIEATVQVTGSVKIDQTGQIGTFLDMATNALDAGNLSEAVTYCNKIIEIDPNHFKAWSYKAKAVGWQSTLANPRISETVNAFSKALDCAPEEEKKEIAKQAKEELKKLFSTMLSLRMGQFEKYPRMDDVIGLKHDANEIVSVGLKFLLKTGLTAEVFSYEYGAIIKNGVWKAAMASRERFNKDIYPSEHDVNRYWEEGEVLIKALEVGLSLCDSSFEDKKSNEVMIDIYETMIKIMQAMTKVTAYKPYYKDGRKHYSVCIDLNFKRIAERQERIKQWQDKIEQIKWQGSVKAAEIEKRNKEKVAEAERREKEKVKRIRDEYWAAHSDEKTALDKEIQELTNEKKRLDEIIGSFMSEKQSFINQTKTITPTESIIAEIDKEIEQCQLELKNTGFFKNQKKEEINARISDLESKKKSLSGQAQAEKRELQGYINKEVKQIMEKMKPSQSRMDEILKRLSELNKVIEDAGGTVK